MKVGNAFVDQYYHMLHESPELVHRFYQDISKLGRPEPNGIMGVTTTMLVSSLFLFCAPILLHVYYLFSYLLCTFHFL